jgi:transposase
MDRIAQDAQHRQRMLEYWKKHGTTKTAIRYRTSRKTVIKWAKRWDGTAESLRDRSRRPHHHPRQHSEEEIKKIRQVVKKHDWSDLLLAFQELQERHGYKRSYGAFKRIVARMKAAKPKKKKRRKNKPYQRAAYPGQKLQLDVKFVPSKCIANGQKYYQFTAKDECTRWTYREMYEEHSTYSAHDFLLKLIEKAPFPIREIQTDNGTEFTNALLVVKAQHKTMFEEALAEMGILYHRIRIATPRHNGKVERQHRTDTQRFYQHLRMYSLEDGRRQLAVYQRKSNDYIMTCLGMRSPNQVLADYLAVM